MTLITPLTNKYQVDAALVEKLALIAGTFGHTSLRWNDRRSIYVWSKRNGPPDSNQGFSTAKLKQDFSLFSLLLNALTSPCSMHSSVTEPILLDITGSDIMKLKVSAYIWLINDRRNNSAVWLSFYNFLPCGLHQCNVNPMRSSLFMIELHHSMICIQNMTE